MATPQSMTLRRRLLLLGAACVVAGPALAYDAASKVSATPGTLPLILTAPHGGTEPLGFVPARTSGVTTRDADTSELAERVAALIEKRTGGRPYLVVARFSRKFLDANRAEAEAMESPDAMPAYRAYHDQLAGFIADIRKKWPEGALLVDVHGQGEMPDTIIRGTRSGLTVKSLVNRFGPQAVQGDKSLFGLLAAKGYAVDPALDEKTLREGPLYVGGHTVATYGSHRPQGIDAIQLEFGRRVRSTPRLAEDVADALIGFMTQHGLMPR